MENMFRPPDDVMDDERTLAEVEGRIYPGNAPISLVIPTATRIFFSRNMAAIIGCVMGETAAVVGILLLLVWIMNNTSPPRYIGWVGEICVAIGIFLTVFFAQAWFVAGFTRYLTSIVRGDFSFIRALRGNFLASVWMALYTLVFGVILIAVLMVLAYLALEFCCEYVMATTIYQAHVDQYLEYGAYLMLLVLLTFISPGLWIIMEYRMNPLSAFIWSLRVTLKNWLSLLLMLACFVAVTETYSFWFYNQPFMRVVFSTMDSFFSSYSRRVWMLCDLSWLVILPYIFLHYPVFCVLACGEDVAAQWGGDAEKAESSAEYVGK